ncbi:polyhydroxyalkanoate synthase [Sphingomonas sp. BE270]|jgi:polyhydroxyalkanoate synthase|uniref:Alpha/beta fold hydrolase n=1 Tax=Sphingomonas echinoides TaxID=59803 RepID=A0ABU4PMC9_9SPHN|nr:MULTISPECIES: alpha/beta fold hydrolase [Sphingomonas]MDR7259589.1 polyhydroxyalkanoate synthase [Sphingomonas sp. BE270]MDX5983100.1 alpha/beta fold hydrolase [Sphingomonas echinoides]
MIDTSADCAKCDPLDGIAQTLDHASAAAIAQMTSGLSPVTMMQAGLDWCAHLTISPGKRLQLAGKAGRKVQRITDYAVRRVGQVDAAPAIEPLPQDRRFIGPAWRQFPFDLISQSFLLTQQWWHAATTGISGVSRHHEEMVAFAARQMLDVIAPTNFFATNPVLQRKIIETGGECLVEGAKHWMEDAERRARGEPPLGTEAFRAGETVAVTPGKVVFRNALVELIQYAPTTGIVRPEPILIVPAWIMKYYIFDLSPENSLIRWLVAEGYTVFVLSWHNPVSADRDLDIDAYRRLGPMAALDVVTAITGSAKVHGVGYCLGGTLLAITASAMARDGDERLASLSLFAAQTEFSEPGELGLFIDEAQLNLLDNMMWSRGYLDSQQMGGAFQILRSNDLIWSQILGTYLMGEREPMTDLMAWNADGTRMPYAMHSEYLRTLFLDDDLAEGRFKVEGRTITLSSLRQQIFVVGTDRDHVAPWRSVHKLHWLSSAEIRFVLASGGHNAGIVSEPGHRHRSYHVATRVLDGPALDPDDWLDQAEAHEGSWWPEWAAWLGDHSGRPQAPPPMGNAEKSLTPLCDAPGQYVLER